MAARLPIELWGRLPDLSRPVPPPRREPSSLGWAVPYWIAAVLFAYAVHADWVPVRAWLETLAASSGSGAPSFRAADRPAEPASPLPEQEARRAAMGIYTETDEDDFGDAESDWEPVAQAGDEEPATALNDDETADEPASEARVQDDRSGEATPDGEPRKGRTRARRRSTARSSEPPSDEAEPRALASDERRRRDEPTRTEALAAAVDEALGSSRRRPAVGSDEAEPDAPTPRLARARSGGGGAMSCEAAIASYREEWTMGGNTGPRDLTAEQFGAVLNSGAYFRHCGVPGSMAVKICAAVQHGQAVGVTVTTTPRSSKVGGCIASAVRGLAFPSHPRMDVTTTVFQPVR